VIDPSQAEERYFRKLEEARRQRIRDEIERAAGELDALGAADQDVVERIKALGFSGETAVAFHLVPLVLVAWADGSVTRAERLQVFAALESRGEPSDGAAARLLATLLEKEPPPTWRERTLEVLRRVAPRYKDTDLVAWCTKVAEASGGLFGFGNRISAAEADAIARISAALNRKPRAAEGG
jgi:hypothetical protein